MSPRNGEEKARNSSRGRGKKKEPHPATPAANVRSSSSTTRLSRSRNKPHPTDNQNITEPQTVSNLSSSEANIELQKTDDTSSLDNARSGSPIKTIQAGSDVLVIPSPGGATAEVSDNRGSTMTLDPKPPLSPLSLMTLPTSSGLSDEVFQSNPDDPWHLTYTELRAMRARMKTLEAVEAATLDFAKQLQAVSTRTATTETTVKSHSTKIEDMEKKITALQSTVEKQNLTIQELQKTRQDLLQLKEDLNQSMQSAKEVQTTKEDLIKLKQDLTTTSRSIKEEFVQSSRKNITEMNKLVEAQKGQVEAFRSIRKDVQQNTQQQKTEVQLLTTSQETMQREMNKKFQTFTEDLEYKSLKDQAFRNRKNIVIIGLPEHEVHSTYSVAMRFFKTDLKARRLDVEHAYRVGQAPSEGSSYIRPLMVKFFHVADRNKIWKLRNKIPQIEQQQRIKIQADLPKQLRDDVIILYRVARAAAAMTEYQSATIKDYAFNLRGKKYTARQLESLPIPIRPSSLAHRQSEQALIFFSKFSPFSNHHPSPFTFDDKSFFSMEQYLAFKHAELVQNTALMEKAMQAQDSVEAKSILNTLRRNNPQEWQERRAVIAAEGLKAKFGQNATLAAHLINTKDLRLGEASKDPSWGIGMTLEDNHALKVNKWNDQGNLLGNLLMQLRTDLATTLT